MEAICSKGQREHGDGLVIMITAMGESQTLTLELKIMS